LSYVRHCLREGVIFRPRPPRLQLEGEFSRCAACSLEISVGEQVALIPLGPGRDEWTRAQALAGHWFDAVAAEVHWACSGYRVPR
jgi:hypothetical protein